MAITESEPGPEPYDRAYFDRWYRQRGFGSPTRLARKVAFAVGAVEYLCDRPVRRVLDVGCGEGAWQPALAAVRPGASYLGVDPSRYAVERFGTRRRLRRGSFGDLDRVVPASEGTFDLVVCSDVLGYVPDAEVPVGLAAIAARLWGLALLEVFTSEDAGRFEGDVVGYRLRPAARWRRWMAAAGLRRVGPNLYVGADVEPTLACHEAPLGR